MLRKERINAPKTIELVVTLVDEGVSRKYPGNLVLVAGRLVLLKFT